MSTPPGGKTNLQEMIGMDVPGAVVYKSKEERYIGRLLQNVKAREAFRAQQAAAGTAYQSDQKLAQLLIAKELVEKATLEQAMQKAKSSGQSLIRTLDQLRAISEHDIAAAIAESTQSLFSTATIQFVDEDARDILPVEAIKQYHAIPLKKSGSALRIAMVNPLDAALVQDLQNACKMPVRPMICTESSFWETYKEYFE